MKDKNNNWYYDKFAKPYLRNKEKLSERELNQVKDFVDRLVPVVMKRKRFQGQNPNWVWNSFFNGTISEVAIENYTGTKFISWKIREEGEEDISDLQYLGLHVGIKTAQMGNLPLVYKSYKIKDPEIITIIDKPYVYIIGYATIPMLKYYQSPNYGFGEVMKYKSGYWGFHKLHEFKTIDDLKSIYNDKNLNEINNFTDTVQEYPSPEGIVTWTNI